MDFTAEDCEKWLKNKSINPKTGRKINPNAKNGIYSKLEKACTHPPANEFSDKDCEKWLKNKSINPKTGRKINPNAKTGIYSKLEKVCKSTNELLLMCWNSEDPITFDPLEDKTINEIITISSSDKIKKYCFLVESLFTYYKTQLAENLPIRNPVDPSRLLTNAEIKRLIEKMKKIDPKAVKKLTKIKGPLRLTHQVRIADMFHPRRRSFEFYEIMLENIETDTLVERLGIIPGFVDPRDSGSTDVSSAVVLAKLYELWEKNRLMVTINPPVCCNVHLRFVVADWFDDAGRFRMDLFEELAYEIDLLL